MYTTLFPLLTSECKEEQREENALGMYIDDTMVQCRWITGRAKMVDRLLFPAQTAKV
jgi:hypothetical protein